MQRNYGDVKIVDNVKIIVGQDRTNTNCFGYIDRNGHKSCYGLNKLYCKNGKCNFYRKDINILAIEKDINKYEKCRNSKGVSLR